MKLLDVAILILATWRLASMLAGEDGPYNVLAKIRYLAGVRYDEHSLPYGKNEVGKMVLCVWCNSVWIGGLWTVVYYFWSGCVWLALPLALSAGAIWLDGGLERWQEQAQERY